MRLLLVEDDALLGDGMQSGLAQAGFEVDWVRDGVAALHAVDAGGYAAMVLDLGLTASTCCSAPAPGGSSCRS
jgi:two-component system OmpR family response regulator/two-component system response regulator QseB